jgi:hypothetical protein
MPPPITIVSQSIQQANSNVPTIRPDITSPVYTNLAENLSAVLARRKEILKPEEKELA